MVHKSILLPIHDGMLITATNIKDDFKPTQKWHNQVKKALKGMSFKEVKAAIAASSFAGSITVSKAKNSSDESAKGVKKNGK